MKPSSERVFSEFAARIRSVSVSLQDVAQFARQHPGWASWWAEEKQRERRAAQREVDRRFPQ